MAITNPHHLALRKLFQEHQNILANNSWVSHYLGTDKKLYQLYSSDKKNLIKNYLKPLNLTFSELNELVLSLSQGESFEELTAVGVIHETFPKFRRQISLHTVNIIFSHTHGWAEVDGNSVFTADDLIDRWPQWKKLLDSFAVDQNINKRRASLTLLIHPVGWSPDPRFADLALTYIDQLLMEKDVLITKAISWILRCMIRYHRELVEQYLEKNKDILPKIALRETRRKLDTGKK